MITFVRINTVTLDYQLLYFDKRGIRIYTTFTTNSFFINKLFLNNIFYSLLHIEILQSFLIIDEITGPASQATVADLILTDLICFKIKIENY